MKGDTTMQSISTFTPAASGSSGVMGQTSASITDDELISEIMDSVERFFFQQAKIAIDNGAPYGGFIILTAGLHHAAGLPQGDGLVNGNEFRDYCQTYLADYDADALWGSLRCGFFHRGVPQPSNGVKSVVVTSKHPENHDPQGTQCINPGCITLDVEKFLVDLRKSIEKLLKKAASDPCLMAKCREAWGK